MPDITLAERTICMFLRDQPRGRVAHGFREVLRVAEEFSGGLRAVMRDPGRDHHHLFGGGVHYPGNDGVIHRNLPVGPRVHHLPIRIVGVLAVAHDLRAGLAVESEMKAQLAGETHGPLVAEGADQDERLAAQIGERRGFSAAHLEFLSVGSEHRGEPRQRLRVSEAGIAIPHGHDGLQGNPGDLRRRFGLSVAACEPVIQRTLRVAHKVVGLRLSHTHHDGTLGLDQRGPELVEFGLAGDQGDSFPPGATTPAMAAAIHHFRRFTRAGGSSMLSILVSGRPGTAWTSGR